MRYINGLIGLILVMTVALPVAAEDAAKVPPGFHQGALVRALVEQDLAWLSRGKPVQVLGRKLFGLEFYERVAAVCADPSPRREVEMRRLKWHYLAQMLILPDASAERARALAAADQADADADRLLRHLGCDDTVTRRIVAEVTG